MLTHSFHHSFYRTHDNDCNLMMAQAHSPRRMRKQDANKHRVELALWTVYIFSIFVLSDQATAWSAQELGFTQPTTAINISDCKETNVTRSSLKTFEPLTQDSKSNSYMQLGLREEACHGTWAVVELLTSIVNSVTGSYCFPAPYQRMCCCFCLLFAQSLVVAKPVQL